MIFFFLWSSVELFGKCFNFPGQNFNGNTKGKISMFWLKLKFQNISTKPQNISTRKCCCMVPWDIQFQVSLPCLFISHDKPDFPFSRQELLHHPICISQFLMGHTHTLEKWMRLWNTNKFPHHPSSLFRWKHFGFQAIGFKKNVSLESKPFFKVSLIENLWFLSTGSFKTAIWFQLVEKILPLSTIPDSHTAWARLAISSNTSKAFQKI